MMADEIKAIDRAATTSVRRATRGARLLIVNQVKRATRGGSRGGNDPKRWIGVSLTPKRGSSRNPVGIVSGRARYKRAGGMVDLLTVLDEGATITARNRKWLAIPTTAAPIRQGRGGTRRARPDEVRFKLVFLQARGGRAVLVREGTRTVMYVLLREVRFSRRINVAAAHARRSAKIVDDFLIALTREDVKLERKYG